MGQQSRTIFLTESVKLLFKNHKKKQKKKHLDNLRQISGFNERQKYRRSPGDEGRGEESF